MNGEERQHINNRVHDEAVSLREYFEAILNEKQRALDERARTQKDAVDAALLAAEKAVNAALAAAEKAVVTARTAQERVNEKQNEFRQTLVDQNATFLPREAFEASLKESNRRLEQLEAQARSDAGVAQGAGGARATALAARNQLIAWAIAAGGLILATIAYLHK